MGSELEPLPRVSKVGKRALALDGVDDEEVMCYFVVGKFFRRGQGIVLNTRNGFLQLVGGMKVRGKNFPEFE